MTIIPFIGFDNYPVLQMYNFLHYHIGHCQCEEFLFQTFHKGLRFCNSEQLLHGNAEYQYHHQSKTGSKTAFLKFKNR